MPVSDRRFLRAYSMWCAGKNYIPCFESKIPGNVCDDLVDGKNHVFGVALLHVYSVDV